MDVFFTFLNCKNYKKLCTTSQMIHNHYVHNHSEYLVRKPYEKKKKEYQAQLTQKPELHNNKQFLLIKKQLELLYTENLKNVISVLRISKVTFSGYFRKPLKKEKVKDICLACKTCMVNTYILFENIVFLMSILVQGN